MSKSRIVFMQLVPADQAKQQVWAEHARSVLGGAAEALRAAGACVVWQLATANHRPLARSARTYASVVEATRDIELVRDGADRLALRSVKLRGQPSYGWYAQLDGTPIMTSARWYSTVRDNRESMVMAGAAIIDALLIDAPRPVDSGVRG